MFLSIRNKILISHVGMVLLAGLAIGGGSYYVISTDPKFTSELAKIKYITISILIIVLAVSGIIFALITRNITNNITNPLKRFIAFTVTIANGDYSQVPDIKSRDEVGILAKSFNHMLIELKQSREDLNMAKEYADNIIETIANAVIVLSEDGTIVKVNKSVYNLLGLEEEDLLNKHIAVIFDNKTHANVLYNELMKSGHVKNVEVIFSACFGVKIPVIFSASVNYGSDGTIDSIVCSAQDITQLKRMHKVRDMHLEELAETNQNLKQSQAQLVQAEKLASLGQMLAGVAHEINTPVGIGITLSSTMAKATEDITAAFDDMSLRKEQLKEYIDEMNQCSSLILKSLLRTADLINSFKQVSTDQITQKKRTFRMREYIEEILLSLQPNLKKYQHNIELICSPKLELDSYPGAMAQIITNLLMNSVMHAYGPGDKGNIVIEVKANEYEVVLTYRDDGKGMPQENLERIYDPFFTTMRGAGGTGLGLHIVHNIVTQTLGGQIVCESALRKGTTFTIKFPMGTDLNLSPVAEVAAA